MKTIFIIINQSNASAYIGYTDKLLNKYWKELISNCCNVNDPLNRTMCEQGIEQFRIRELEEIYVESKLDERLAHWIDKYDPVYNKEVKEHVPVKKNYFTRRKDWAKGKTSKKDKVLIKAREIATGKIKQWRGWHNCANKVNGDYRNILKAMKRGGSAYGYDNWRVVERPEDPRRPVYGVDATGNHTKVFESITAASRALGEQDNKGTKGICTSLKYKTRYKGYNWYYA
jgi:hypothetical protein